MMHFGESWHSMFVNLTVRLYLGVCIVTLSLSLCTPIVGSHETSGQLNISNTSLPTSNRTYSLLDVKPKVWIASIVSIVVISTVGLLGVAMVPLMLKVFYNHVTQFLVALAVGSLTGDAFLHLLPHAIVASLFHGQHAKDGHDDKATVYKGLVALAGVYVFFMAEKLVVLITEYRAEKKAKEEERVARLNKHSVSGPPGGAGVALDAISDTAGSNSAVQPMSSTGQGPTSSTSQMQLRATTPTSELNPLASKVVSHSQAVASNRLRPGPPDTEEFVAIGISGRAMRNIDDIIRRAGSERALYLGPHDEELCMAASGSPPEGCTSPSCLDQELASSGSGPSGLPNNHYNNNNNATSSEQVPLQPLRKRTSTHSGDNVGKETQESPLLQRLQGRKLSGDVAGKKSKHSHGHGHGHGHSHEIPGSMQAVMWMVILGDGLHNFSDGLAIGAAFAQSISGGVSTAVAVFCHELPHELGDFAALLAAGMPAKQAILYNVLSSFLCFIGMLVGIALGNIEEVSYWIFAVAGGTFIYIALVDMLPELGRVERRHGESRWIHFLLHNLGILTGVGIMLVIALYEDKIKGILDRDML